MAKRAAQPVVSRRVDLDLEDGDNAGRYVLTVAPAPAEDDGAGYLIAGLVLGTLLGAAVGLFLAPRSGEETRRTLLNRLPGSLGEPAEEPAGELPAANTEAVPTPTNATSAALDPVAQVEQYQEPPARETAPPYTAGQSAPPSNTP
jgi:hypothetical protein